MASSLILDVLARSSFGSLVSSPTHPRPRSKPSPSEPEYDYISMIPRGFLIRLAQRSTFRGED